MVEPGREPVRRRLRRASEDPYTPGHAASLLTPEMTTPERLSFLGAQRIEIQSVGASD